MAFCNKIQNRAQLQDSSLTALIGTSAGLLYEVAFTSDATAIRGKGVSKEKSCRVAHKLDHPISITSLCIELVHSTASSSGDSSSGSSSGSSSNSATRTGFGSKNDAHNNNTEPQLLVLYGTSSPTRLYHFMGPLAAARQSIHAFFTLLSGDSSFTELPSNPQASANSTRQGAATIGSSRLLCSSIPTVLQEGNSWQTAETEGIKSNARQIFALMTQLGIYHGPLKLYDTYVRRVCYTLHARIKTISYNLLLCLRFQSIRSQSFL